MNQKNVNRDWVTSIAERADANPDSVEQILADYRIQASPVVPAPRRLLLKRIHFSGIKDGVDCSGEFEFEWDKLDHGLWAILTDSNLKGKSSVLEVVRWLLRGRPTANLQDDVRSWIRESSLSFQLDEVDYKVEIQCGDDVTGKLSRFSRPGNKRKIGWFGNELEFEAVMSDFFMREFSMDLVAVYRKSGDVDGRTVLHGWHALSGVMFIGTDYTTLVGDLAPNTGLPIRLTQMYLGIPWISTLASAKAAVAEQKRKLAAKSKLEQDANELRDKRLKQLHGLLETKQDELTKLPSMEIVEDRFKNIGIELSKFKEDEILLSNQIRQAKKSVTAVEAIYLEDRRTLQTHLEYNAADAVFRALDPTCCPRCEKSISESRKKTEKETNECAVCGKQVHSNVNAAELQHSLEQQTKASKQAQTKARRVLKNLLKNQSELTQAIEAKQKQITTTANKISKLGQRSNVLTEIAVLKARIEEASSTDLNQVYETDELKILNAVVKETNERVKELQNDVFQSVSEGIVTYAQRFGMSALTSASLKGNMVLKLTKGGEETSYSKVTEGEKLRLKVATVLAMISVGEKKGVGRYPGLLMIDSPGAQEVASKDLEQLISGLEDLSNELEHIQVIVASISSDAILNHVDESRLKQSHADNPLW